ncbi:MAG: DUF3168 domain-containing protein [Pseudomonadota bacterium]
MSAAGWALQKAIFDALSADAALKALIGDPPRVFDIAPLRGPFPFVVFGDAREAKVSGADNLIEHDIRFAVHSRYEGRREVKDIVTAIVSALDEAPLALAGFHLISLRAAFSDIFHRPDADAYQGLIRFRAVTERS